MIREVRTPDLINAFANHPEIRPFLGGAGDLDLTPGVTDNNVFLFGERGGFCFIWSAPETYEVHVMLTRAGRGAWGVCAGRRAIKWMVDKGMTHLWGRIHPQRPEIGKYAALCGLKDTGTIHELDTGDGPVRWRIFNWRA